MMLTKTIQHSAIGAATLALMLAGGCASSGDLRADASGQWRDDPVRAALVAWEAAVGDDAVRFSVLGPVSVSASRWGPDGPASMAAVEAAGVPSSSVYEPRIVTHRASGTRQELEVHGFAGGQWRVLGWEGDRAWRLNPKSSVAPPPPRLAVDGGGRRPAGETIRPSMRVRSIPEEPLLGLFMAWPMVGGRAFAWDQSLQRTSLVDWLDASDEIEVRAVEGGRYEVIALQRRGGSAPVQGRHLAVASESQLLIRLRLEPRPRIEEVTLTSWNGQSFDPDVAPTTMLSKATHWVGMDFIATGAADVAHRGRVWNQHHRVRRPDGGRSGSYAEYQRMGPDAAVAAADVAWGPFPVFPPAAASVPGAFIDDQYLGLRYTIGDDRVRTGSGMSAWRLLQLDGPIDAMLGADWERRVVAVLGEGGPTPMDTDIMFPGLNDAG